jgi:hypothetical protein
MLWSANSIRGFCIRAIDGSIGAVDECLFDDRQWVLRSVVANLGDWLLEHFVLVPPTALKALDGKSRTLEVALTCQQVTDSPDIATDPPVSHQIATDRSAVTGSLNYGGASGFWGLGMCMGEYSAAARLLAFEAEQDGRRALERSAEARRRDPHLRSTRAVCGCAVRACDGAAGHIVDFILDDTVWAIRYLVVTSRMWWPGKRVLVPARWIGAIDLSRPMVGVDAPRAVLQCGPVFDPAVIADPAYETWLCDAYARMQAPERVVGA